MHVEEAVWLHRTRILWGQIFVAKFVDLTFTLRLMYVTRMDESLGTIWQACFNLLVHVFYTSSPLLHVLSPLKDQKLTYLLTYLLTP